MLQLLQGAEEAHKLVIWSGKVKHRLKTADGASTVELFNVSVMVPEKLMEQMPPTLFVSALAGLFLPQVTPCSTPYLQKPPEKIESRLSTWHAS